MNNNNSQPVNNIPLLLPNLMADKTTEWVVQRLAYDLHVVGHPAKYTTFNCKLQILFLSFQTNIEQEVLCSLEMPIICDDSRTYLFLQFPNLGITK